jgi:hypothetical protein
MKTFLTADRCSASRREVGGGACTIGGAFCIRVPVDKGASVWCIDSNNTKTEAVATSVS